MQGFEVSPLFAAQISTPSRGTLMAARATFPSYMMASGSTIALVSDVRTATSGVPPPTTMARTSVGASVLSRVSYLLNHKDWKLPETQRASASFL